MNTNNVVNNKLNIEKPVINEANIVQELNHDNYRGNLEFCKIINGRAGKDPQICFNICFSKINNQNRHDWSD